LGGDVLSPQSTHGVDKHAQVCVFSRASDSRYMLRYPHLECLRVSNNMRTALDIGYVPAPAGDEAPGEGHQVASSSGAITVAGSGLQDTLYVGHLRELAVCNVKAKLGELLGLLSRGL